MPEKRIQETICYLIVQVSKEHRYLASQALAELGLHPGQELLLMHLWESDGLTQSELVGRLAIEPPTLTKMLNRLEGSGLVQRQRDPDDARICRAYLTDAGRSLQASVLQRWLALETRLLNNLTLEEQCLLRRLLLQLRDNLR